MAELQDWVFSARGRTITARVLTDGQGGGTITRFSVSPGPSQTGLSIKVASEKDAALKLERVLTDLLSARW